MKSSISRCGIYLFQRKIKKKMCGIYNQGTNALNKSWLCWHSKWKRAPEQSLQDPYPQRKLKLLKHLVQKHQTLLHTPVPRFFSPNILNQSSWFPSSKAKSLAWKKPHCVHNFNLSDSFTLDEHIEERIGPNLGPSNRLWGHSRSMPRSGRI